MLRPAHAWPIIDFVLERSPSTLIGGRYVVGESFGAGGMGTVHLGRVVGAGGFSRVVAIKKLFPGFATDRDFRQMLLDEARLAARIRHPNVVSTLDVVEADSDLYIVMEYVHGLSLAELIDRSGYEPIPIEIALGIVQAFLLGLHAAHEARGEDGAPLGIVHRDVSPQNVLVGADGVPRLIDFGIAKAATRIHVTDPGVMKGKAAYMAPEQLMREPVSRHADVFSSAVGLWELLANRPLFPDSDIASRIRNLNVEPIPPSKLRVGVSPALDAVVLQGLAREPTHRFATAQSMALAIGRAGKAASAVEIAKWLATHAADELELSEERVRLLEQSPPEIATGAPVIATLTTTRTTRRPRLLIAGAVVVAAVAAVAIGMTTRSTSSASAVATASSGAPSALTAAAPSADPTASGAVALSAPASVGPAPASAAPSRARPARSRATGKHACDPPYTVDSTGFKHYDPACF